MVGIDRQRALEILGCSRILISFFQRSAMIGEERRCTRHSLFSFREPPLDRFRRLATLMCGQGEPPID